MLGNGLSLTAQTRPITRSAPVSLTLVSGTQIAPHIAVSRSGPATVFGPTGALGDVAPDTPRLTHDPITLARQGIQLEPVSANLLPYSTADPSHWSASGATTSALALAALGRFGGVEIASQGATFHRLNSSLCQLAGGQSYYLTTFFRPGSSSTGRITIRNAASGDQATLQGTIGSWSQSSASAGTLTTLQNETLHDGTIRLVIRFDALLTGDYTVGVGPHSTTLGDSIILLAMQIETGAASSYIPTQATPGLRGAESLHIQGLSGLYDLHLTYGSGQVETQSNRDLTGGYSLVPSEPVLSGLTATPS